MHKRLKSSCPIWATLIQGLRAEFPTSVLYKVQNYNTGRVKLSFICGGLIANNNKGLEVTRWKWRVVSTLKSQSLGCCCHSGHCMYPVETDGSPSVGSFAVSPLRPTVNQDTVGMA